MPVSSDSAKSRVFKALRTLVFSFLISMTVLCLIALLMWKLSLSETQVQTGLYLCCLLSCMFGGLCFGHIFPKRHILWGICFGAAYFLMLFAISAIAHRAAPELSPRSFVVLGICCLGGFAGAFFS